MRLGTWNVLNGISLIDGRVDAGRLRAAAAELDVDVLGLQEVDRGHPRSHGLDLAAEVAAGLGARHWRFTPALIGAPGGRWRAAVDRDDDVGEAYGIALVSRYPVRQWRVLRLPPAPLKAPVLIPGSHRLLWLQDEPRVVLAAVVETPSGVVTVASTHLSFVPGWNVLQLRRLSRWLQRLPQPQVLLGDLNLPPRVAGTVSGFHVLARHPTYPAPRPRLQLDHVLGRGALMPVAASAARALDVSDHRALWVELGWAPAARGGAGSGDVGSATPARLPPARRDVDARLQAP